VFGQLFAWIALSFASMLGGLIALGGPSSGSARATGSVACLTCCLFTPPRTPTPSPGGRSVPPPCRRRRSR
jgi:hypothetical protein